MPKRKTSSAKRALVVTRVPLTVAELEIVPVPMWRYSILALQFLSSFAVAR
jgi:hypothetical protein